MKEETKKVEGVTYITTTSSLGTEVWECTADSKTNTVTLSSSIKTYKFTEEEFYKKFNFVPRKPK